jgi:hypothetical protein
MKGLQKKLSAFATKVQDGPAGTLESGFLVLSINNNTLILGGEDTNNCNGGNCVKGCGQNDVQGCGDPTNQVRGCGGNGP